MNSISQKVTSRSGLSKAILVIRKKVVCFKEGKQLFGDDSLHSLRDEWSDCNWGDSSKGQTCPLFWGYGKHGQVSRKKEIYQQSRKAERVC